GPGLAQRGDLLVVFIERECVEPGRAGLEVVVVLAAHVAAPFQQEQLAAAGHVLHVLPPTRKEEPAVLAAFAEEVHGGAVLQDAGSRSRSTTHWAHSPSNMHR